MEQTRYENEVIELLDMQDKIQYSEYNSNFWLDQDFDLIMNYKDQHDVLTNQMYQLSFIYNDFKFQLYCEIITVQLYRIEKFQTKQGIYSQFNAPNQNGLGLYLLNMNLQNYLGTQKEKIVDESTVDSDTNDQTYEQVYNFGTNEIHIADIQEIQFLKKSQQYESYFTSKPTLYFD